MICSLCQGEQVSQLWPSIFELGLSIHFAYPTFPWANNARDKAAVHVIIVGLSANAKAKCLYQNVCGEWHSLSVKNISPYLVEGSDIAVYPVSKPLIKGVPPILFGNKPTDGGSLLLDRSEYDQLMEREPSAKKWIKRVLGADEFLNSKERWCLWLVGASNEDIARMPLVHERVKAVETFRINSSKEATRKKSSTPHLFDENRHPTSGNYIVIPRVSSQLRRYIPIGFYDHNVISTDRNFILPSGTLYEFAILMSLIHNEWMRLVAMRLKSDYSYGNKVVYNTFPWPSPNEQQRQNLVQLAENILLAREDYPGKTLAELYNPDSMPDDLKNAHAELDNAVDKLYRDKPFRDTADRLSFLLARYEAMVAKQEE